MDNPRYDSATNKIGIIPSVLRKLAEEAGVDDVKAFLEYLDGKGMIDKDTNGNLTKNVYSSCLAKGNRMHVIQMKKAFTSSTPASSASFLRTDGIIPILFVALS